LDGAEAAGAFVAAGLVAPAGIDEEFDGVELVGEDDEPLELDGVFAAPVIVTVSWVLPRTVGSSINSCKEKPGPSSPFRLTVTVTIHMPLRFPELAVKDQV
jgi:hypothetical protein